MAADLQRFFFKSKFMRKLTYNFALVIFFNVAFYLVLTFASECKDQCQHGLCTDAGLCECDPGWTGKHCQFCFGKIRLEDNSGIITDGAGNYSVDNQCTWLIDPGASNNNSVVRLYLDHFATECSWDHLYIYDGGSIYDPLLAVFSGVIVQDHNPNSTAPVVTASSGRALIHFYSDAAYNLTGFSISFKIGGCPSTSHDVVCSGHGACLDNVCTCDGGWSGDSCNTQICPSNCSDHGQCNMEEHRCTCNLGYTGNDCSQKVTSGWWDVPLSGVSSPLHPNDSSVHTELERASHAVSVIDNIAWIAGGYTFTPKSFLIALNLTDFSVVPVKPLSKLRPSSRYGHSLVNFNGSLYMYGGTLENGLQTSEFWKFSINDLQWQRVEPFTPQPHKLDPKNKESKSISSKSLNRNQRSNRKSNLVGLLHRDVRSDKVLVELDPEVEDEYNTTQKGNVNYIKSPPDSKDCQHPIPGPCPPVASVGHAAVVIKDSIILVIFGYSSLYGTLNLVQEYYFHLNQWKIVETQGALTAGAYGMSAIWDPDTSLVYCHGGLRVSASTVGADLLSYDPFQHKWTLKTPAPFPRFLHTAFHMPGMMLFFGGNTHNDTSYSYGAKCYSADFLAYDIYCNKWHWIQKPPHLGSDVARYGHSAINYEGNMLVLGGFNGMMLQSSLLFHPGSCGGYSSRSECLDSFPGRKCIWNRALDRCENFLHENKIGSYVYCGLTSLDEKVNYASFCAQLTTCNSCLTHSNYGCLWCKHKCLHEKCSDYTKGIVSPNGCEEPKIEFCKSIKSCRFCQQYHPTCLWLNKECTFASPNMTVFQSSSSFSLNKSSPTSLSKPLQSPEKNGAEEESSSPSPSIQRPSQWTVCQPLCSQRTTCDNCTQGTCMWCFSEQRCVSNNSYLISFPYGQCREWTTGMEHCFYIEKGQNKCMVHQTCKKCQADVGCGWCDDNSGTGTGVCLPGGYSGPINPKTKDLQTRSCPKNRWFFTSCPPCSCNGHSYCLNSSDCVQPCGNDTTGLHCDHCKESYHGNPINGGLCKRCQCNGHGDTCESTTGKCHCHTKGVTGDHCESCDTQNNYYGIPLEGSCFYDLQIDYQFTFNLSKQEDMHIRKINFYNVPSKPDVDTDFDIQCTKPTQIRISAIQTGNHETWIVQNFTGTSIKRRFSASDYIFGSPENNTTFHVYVFDIVPPIEIVISFSQHPKLDLIQFFSIFTLCFMFLLLMAFVMWKIKQKYDLYTRRQRLMVEIRAMASRPFQSIFLELQLNESGEETEEQEPSADVTSNNGSEEASAIAEDSKHINGPIPVVRRQSKNNAPKAVKKPDCSSKESKDLINNAAESLSKLNGGGTLKRKCNGAVSAPPQMYIHRPDSFIYKNKNNPSPVALEPCVGNKAAVLSLLVQLPNGGGKHTPSGHPGGLAAASTLVSLGTPCHSSVDISSPPKEIPKGKNVTKVKIISPNNYDSSI